MKTLAAILLFIFSLSLGGVQLFLTSGQHMARQRAIKFQRIRSEKKTELQTITFDAHVFDQMEIENVGHGVIEFEYQGSMYDAFEVIRTNNKVLLLVKKDGLDTAISHAMKQVKRFTRAKGQQLKNMLFNFYFAPFIAKTNHFVDQITLIFAGFRWNYSTPFLGSISPPPW